MIFHCGYSLIIRLYEATGLHSIYSGSFGKTFVEIIFALCLKKSISVKGQLSSVHREYPAISLTGVGLLSPNCEPVLEDPFWRGEGALRRLCSPWISVFTAKQHKLSQKGENGVLPAGFDFTDNKLYSAVSGLCAHGSPAWTDLALLVLDTTELGGKWSDHRGACRRGMGGFSSLLLSKFCH